MNIFFLHVDPEICASYHCDKHCVKMILETAQLLCNAHYSCQTNDIAHIPYRKTHYNHPCAVWVRKSLYNYLWLLRLGFALCAEYKKRYNKIHKCEKIMFWCEDNIPNLPEEQFTLPPQCMPDEYKCEDTIKAYKNYYIGDKSRFAKWSYSKTPEWFKNGKSQM